MLLASLEERRRERRLITLRIFTAGLLIITALGILLMRLVELQIKNHEHFTVLSLENQVKIQPIAPSRGLIYDAHGRLLADNYPSFSLEITLEKVIDLTTVINELGQILLITEKDRARFKRLKNQRMRFQGVPIRLNLTESEVARFAVDTHRFPGVEIHAGLLRTYPLGALTAHVLGYVGRINEEEIKRIDSGNYAGTNFIGKGGVELAHEEILHGQVGNQQVEVNARGRILRTLENTPPKPGQDLFLNLDLNLQKAATAALGERRGAVVAIDPQDGGVLALVSIPSFDPNQFVEGIAQTDYQNLLNSPDKPLYNRAVRGQYPPGSTIKPFIGLGGLALRVITPRKTAFCPGSFTLPGQSHQFRCWRHTGHGTVNLEQAIIQSCDVYFYSLANQIGIDRLAEFLTQFNFGLRTGIDLAGELPGLLPSRIWKQRVRRQAWYPGETLIVGIGQGYFLATPLQLAAATATLANRGHFIVPHLARASRAPGDSQLHVLQINSRRIEINDPQVWTEIIQDMTQVVESPRGTAKRIRSSDYRIAGKTGTAQVFTVGQKESYNSAKIPERMRDHALFIAFAPVEAPKIAVAVLVENGGHGGSTAAPVARRVIDAYLGGTPLPSEGEESDED